MNQALRTQVQILGSMVALMWISALLNPILFGGHLIRFGIIPRSLVGLRGILFAPFPMLAWGI